MGIQIRKMCAAKSKNGCWKLTCSHTLTLGHSLTSGHMLPRSHTLTESHTMTSGPTMASYYILWSWPPPVYKPAKICLELFA